MLSFNPSNLNKAAGFGYNPHNNVSAAHGNSIAGASDGDPPPMSFGGKTLENLQH